MPLIGGRFFTVIENMQAKTDVMEAELSKELENGRLFRLLTKMNTVLERVEHASDENWSETGDRFMLKLFRDYVFHQNTEHGKAWLDMAHIVQCLNKLDSGSLEKIEMVSRSGDTQIIIDYNQLKKCLEKSFRELAGAPPLAMLQRH
uniref:Pan3_PK domain-containing protein n=1 Tax=Caenorhabditis japonica TaxID=281687 RepID=A0A8R1ISM0_CAEJA